MTASEPAGTGAELGETVDALTTKLDLKSRACHAAADTKNRIVEKTTETAGTVIDKATDDRGRIKPVVPLVAVVVASVAGVIFGAQTHSRSVAG
jgi:hypothetical protein